MATQTRLSLVSFSRGALIFLLAVILWGSFVRASGSGAGCGAHWPLCNGVILPESASWKTLVEFTHRLTSGMSLILCAGICWISFRQAPRGSLVRKAGAATLVLMLTEALIGAGLVLLKLVESDQSALRAVSMSIHLLNTFLLLGAVTLTVKWSARENPRLRNDEPWLGSAAALFLMLVLGASGAVTALGDTLFPTQTLAQGMAADFSPARHFLIGLRIYHPLLALGVSFYLVMFARWTMRRHPGQRQVHFHATLLVGLQCAQLVLGLVNLILLAPIAVQLLHLLCADVIWINLVCLIAEVFTV
jgi:heme A synthase